MMSFPLESLKSRYEEGLGEHIKKWVQNVHERPAYQRVRVVRYTSLKRVSHACRLSRKEARMLMHNPWNRSCDQLALTHVVRHVGNNILYDL